MRISVVMSTVVMLAAPAAADSNFELHAGVGLPAGGVGLGMRSGPVEVLVEGQVIGGPFIMLLSTGVHVNVDVLEGPHVDLYAGGLGALLHIVTGSDEVFEETYRGGGAVFGIRLHRPSSRLSHAIELGAFYGQCAQHMCVDGPSFLSVEVAYRFHFRI